MCARSDFPPYDPPTPQPPRVYRLSGSKPELHGSIALAVIGQMIEEAETLQPAAGLAALRNLRRDVALLREARDRIAAAEAQL